MRTKKVTILLAAAILLAGVSMDRPVQAQGPGVGILAVTVVTTFSFKLTATSGKGKPVSGLPVTVTVVADTLDEAWGIMAQLIGLAKIDAKLSYAIDSVDQTYTP